MAREKVHRVFVVEGGMIPRGLVTQVRGVVSNCRLFVDGFFVQSDICRVLSERLSGAKFGKKQQQKAMKKHCKKHLQVWKNGFLCFVSEKKCCSFP